MEDKFNLLKQRLAQVVDLQYAASLMSWDQETKMPGGGTKSRADQLATLQSLAHQYFTDEELGGLLDDLTPWAEALPFDSVEASLIRVNKADYLKRVLIPADLIGELAHATAVAKDAWKQARAENRFALFQPHLERIIDLRRQWADCFAPYDNPYDPLLDYFEPGLTQAEIKRVFEGLRPQVVALVAAIAERRDAVDKRVVMKEIDEDRQVAFNREVTEAVGYTYQHGRLDKSAHPFTSRIAAPYDVRITTRFKRDNPVDALMSSIHEAGHAIHFQNFDPALYRTRLDLGPAQAINESQSRFFENVIGRSLPFWTFMYPKLQKAYAPHFDDVTLTQFHRALHHVEPGLIRVEADEVTYGLHIMLRFELEDDLINRRLAAADLPEAWNEKMRAYLGIVPPTDALGVLQDIHWSDGLIGYFPDYLLGSILSAQLWEAMKADLPDVERQFERGEISGALGWLRDHVMRYGRSFTLPQISEHATGKPLSGEPYMNYLRERYGTIYGV